MSKQPADEPILKLDQDEKEQPEQEQPEQEQTDFLPSQSEMDKEAKDKQQNKKLILMLFLLVGLVGFGFLWVTAEKPVSRNQQEVKQEDYKLEIDTTQLYTSDLPDENVFNPGEPEETSPRQSKTETSEQVESEGINALIVSKLDDLLIKQEALSYKVEALSERHTQLEQIFKKSETELLARVNHVAKISQAIGLDGQRRDSAISELLTVVKGFDSSIKEQRYSFPLEVLHTEIWSGKQRVVAIKPSEPRHLIKIYVGQEYDGWLLTEITSDKAIFKQVEIGELMEVSL
ncbi:hypothetical protein [Pseudoalteromonas luteoviolacea]|uniref:Uncharacterized protein n=1 Tax=Pseudoalteromonas luteoviolacea S4060-1 TaxID=1365257 RepID=A0A167KVW2_9GAMM|nr:hypothetical protein [Pseudoalteromonas luteoviolacea]KZN63370.1 hypothetical protein N478_03715 [Pseudoalteromonas luteoviolacea S4060-1]